jgi:hypothetical protein
VKNLLVSCCIVLGVIFVYGFIAGREDRLRIQTREEQLSLVVTVTLPDVSAEYAWVSLYLCTAERGEDNPQAYCTGDWDTESTHPTRPDQMQYPFPLRSVPGGLLLVTAMAFDANGKIRARRSVPIHRGF